MKTGTDNIGLEGCGWSRVHTSLVFSRTVKQLRKKTHSRRMLIKLVIPIARP